MTKKNNLRIYFLILPLKESGEYAKKSFLINAKKDLNKFGLVVKFAFVSIFYRIQKRHINLIYLFRH